MPITGDFAVAGFSDIRLDVAGLMVVREAANPVRVVFAGGPIVDWGWDWRNDKRELDVVDVGVGAAELRFDKLGLGLWLGIVLEAVEEARDAAGVPGPANCFTGDLVGDCTVRTAS